MSLLTVFAEMIYYCRQAAILSIVIASLVVISLPLALPVLSSPVDDEVISNLTITKAIPFHNASISSIAIDTISNHVYVSVIPVAPTSCLQQDNTAANSESDFPCSFISILDGNTDQIIDEIRLRYGELIHATDIDRHSGNIYAAGEYNYLKNDTTNGEEPVQYEDDVVYIIKSNDKNQTSIGIQRIKLYGEIEEGKEGDMSAIAVDARTGAADTIYAGIRYFMGGREGVFVIDESSSADIPITIKFIPLGDTGPDQILVNNLTNTIYTSLEYDNFISLIDSSNNTVKEEIILQQPRAMSINPSEGLLYVASGDSNWINVVNMNTSKVIASNTRISYPVASVVDNVTGRVYVANCLKCDDFDFTIGSSIYELDSSGSTLNWETYDNVDIGENGLAINPSTNKLYVVGTDLQSGISNLYVIDVSL